MSGPEGDATQPPRQYYVPPPEVPAPDAPAPEARPGDVAAVDPWTRVDRRSGAADPPRSPARHRSGRSGGARSRRGPSRHRLRRALRPKWRWIFLYLPLAVILLVLGALGWAWYRVDSLYRVDLDGALAAPTAGPVNYLLVGSDSREGITAETPNAGVIGPGVSGRRSDTIIVLRVGAGRSTMMSVPRDLWVSNPETGRNGRINATYNDGAANLVRAVTTNLGIPIHHYLEVSFVSFSGMVDAMGGITIDFAHPALDHQSGLNIISSGPVHLDGTQALAYVRSRHYVEVIDGRQVPDPTSDLGRQQRQQTFIRTVLAEVGGTRNPLTLLHLLSAAADGTRVDDQLGFGDLFSLARNLSGNTPQSVVLPTRAARKGKAQVLVLRTAEATPVLATFDGAPHAPQ